MAGISDVEGRRPLLLAPLRGVTGRCFRETFADEIAQAGFTEAVTPFITANAGFDPLKGTGLRPTSPMPTTPQFIGKDPEALRSALLRIRDAGFGTADLNCGCPFPMVRNKGRGSGLLRTPDILRRMLDAGCATMGEGRFSVKARLGVERPDELLALMPLLNCYPLRFLAVHARTARQMYGGEPDRAAFLRIAECAKMPLVYNGDAGVADDPAPAAGLMVGRAFVRSLGEGDGAGERLDRYIEASRRELSGERPVLGRMKELVSYWKDLPRWKRLWPLMKLARTLGEFRVWR